MDSRYSFPGRGKRFFCAVRCPHRLSEPQILLSDDCREFPSRGKAVRAWSWPFISISCQSQEWSSCTSTPPISFLDVGLKAQKQVHLYFNYERKSFLYYFLDILFWILYLLHRGRLTRILRVSEIQLCFVGGRPRLHHFLRLRPVHIVSITDVHAVLVPIIYRQSPQNSYIPTYTSAICTFTSTCSVISSFHMHAMRPHLYAVFHSN
jgi:hypothetical protein